MDNFCTLITKRARAHFLTPLTAPTMTEEQLSSTWKMTLKQMEGAFPSAIYKSVFGTSSLKGVSGDIAEVTVDNQVARNFVSKYAEEKLLKNLSEVLGAPITQARYTIKPVAKEAKNIKSHTEKGEELFHSNKNHSLEPNQNLSSNLNPKYTFSSFIVGNRNRLAHAAARAVAESPGNLYNPLYLYGGVGLGKTHLMQAIGNEILRTNPEKKVLYVSCESFMNEFVASIRGAGQEAFKKKYRNINVFLVDDIQFIAGKDGIQEEFFHTFNALYQTNAQIVITSDIIPSEMKGLEDRLSSRFSAGMIADMQLPDLETRQAILISKCQERGIILPNEAITYIADQIDTNIRELEGALSRVVLAIHASGNTHPSLNDVKTALTGIISTNRPSKKSSAQSLMDLVCQFYSIELADLLGPRRQQELVRPRQILMYLLKHELGMTFPAIGREVGGRDHTTAMHSVDKIEKEMKKSPELLEELQHLKEQLYTVK